MRIHSDILTEADIRAAVPSTAYIGKLTVHGSRKRAHGYEVNLGGSGKTGGQWGQTDGKAATWDEWGMFLAALYKIDPDITMAAYVDHADFDYATGSRFDTLTPAEQHYQHKWVYVGPYEFECKGSKNKPCTATLSR